MFKSHGSEPTSTTTLTRKTIGFAGLSLFMALLASNVADAAPKMPPNPSSTQLEGICNEHGGLYSPPNINGVYWCLFPDGTLVACGGLIPYCTQSLVYQDKGIGLSDVQTVKLKRLTSDYERSRIRIQASLDLAEVEIQMLVQDEKSDMSAIDTAVRKSEAARADMRVSGIKALRAAFAVLNQEQRERLHTLIETRYAARGKEDCTPRAHKCGKEPSKKATP
jgi:hypothetical protein